MCGKGPQHEALVKVSPALGLDIDFPGFVSEQEKAQYLANADVAVFPSISGESFGIVLTEAMSAGAGITLGGNNPGYSSVIGRWPEVLFNPNDIQSFSDLLVRAAQDTDFRRTIGKQQHEYAKQFDIKTICDQLVERYSL